MVEITEADMGELSDRELSKHLRALQRMRRSARIGYAEAKFLHAEPAQTEFFEAGHKLANRIVEVQNEIARRGFEKSGGGRHVV